MVSARHDPAALAAFQDGERCLVWARRKADGSLYRLSDGDARALKPWAKEHLECFMPDCGDRRLTTVARHPRRRDGFSHHAGSGGHSAESEAHQQGKAALVAWVTEALRPQGVTAVAEQSTSDRKRIADVMVTWSDGRQVALEVQYAPLSVEQWRARHESYRDQGIPAVWLLGHASKHLRAARKHSWENDGAADGLVALGDLHSAMARAGVPVLWINPVLGDGATIGTASVAAGPHRGRHERYGDGHDDAVFDIPPGPDDDRAAFLADPLADCSLTPSGLSTPGLDRLRQAATTLAAVDAARTAADQARAAAQAEARKTRAAREQAEAERRARWRQEQRDRQQAAWDTSALKQRVLARYNGAVPPLLTVRLGFEGGVYAPPEHWRAAVYRDLVWNKTGRSFTVADAYASIRAEGIALDRSSPRPRALAVLGWLDHLQRRGYVEVHRDPDQPRHVLRVTVLGDLDNPPLPKYRHAPAQAAPHAPPPARTPPCRPDPRPPTAPERPGPATAPADDGAVLLRRQLGAVPVPSGGNRGSDRHLRCRRCHLPLDPRLADTGLHLLC